MNETQITCAIIDDEPLAVKLLQTYVAKTPFLVLSGTYNSAVEAVYTLQTHPVNLLFLDIQMPDLNGLDFAKVIGSQTRIIFTTAFSQYAIDGYKVNAIDYLLKPISYTDFINAAQKALANIVNDHMPQPEVMKEEEDAKDSFFVKSDYKVVRIRYDDVLYVEGLKDYVKIHLESNPRPILSLISMRMVEHFLPSKQFVRIHRSYIVNLQKINVVERSQVVFGDKKLPISDSYRDQIMSYVSSKMLQGRVPPGRHGEE